MCKDATSNVCVPAIRKRHEVFVARDKGCHLGQAHGKPYDTSRARRKVWVSSASNQDMNEHGYDTARERANVWAWRECPPKHRSSHALISAIGRGCMELLLLRGNDEGHASLSVVWMPSRRVAPEEVAAPLALPLRGSSSVLVSVRDDECISPAHRHMGRASGLLHAVESQTPCVEG